MIVHNELVIDGVRTSSFRFRVIVHESPSVTVGNGKTILLEHAGISGALTQTNKHKGLIERVYTLYLVKPTEEELNRFLGILSREKFWLESERVKTTRLWCYKVSVGEVVLDERGVYSLKVTFVCHPTRFFKDSSRQVLTSNGILRVQGSALAFPTITISGSSANETSFTVGKQVIKLANLSETVVMVNSPDKPSVKTVTGKAVKWAGDFLTIDTSSGQDVGVVLGPGIRSLTFDVIWGWS